MKLTPELIAQSPSAINTLKDRELSLRGHKIPAIDNLGVTKDQHDSIDLTDNVIATIANIPRLPRLKNLYLANNSISSIHPSVSTSIPNLNTLILTNNSFIELGDLEILSEFKVLEYLSLMGNAVREKKYYREWIIFHCKRLRVLDFQRVTDKERSTARGLFLTPDSLPTALSVSLSSARANPASIAQASATKTFIPGVDAAGRAGRLMTAEEKERVKEAIKNASSVEEIRKLEATLREGWVPT
jgi:U2 small nuclear ribonucleoprotein A'